MIQTFLVEKVNPDGTLTRTIENSRVEAKKRYREPDTDVYELNEFNPDKE
jgi:hypothetical protein